jgi:hypothetical protein
LSLLCGAHWLARLRPRRRPWPRRSPAAPCLAPAKLLSEDSKTTSGARTRLPGQWAAFNLATAGPGRQQVASLFSATVCATCERAPVARLGACLSLAQFLKPNRAFEKATHTHDWRPGRGVCSAPRCRRRLRRRRSQFAGRIWRPRRPRRLLSSKSAESSRMKWRRVIAHLAPLPFAPKRSRLNLCRPAGGAEPLLALSLPPRPPPSSSLLLLLELLFRPLVRFTAGDGRARRRAIIWAGRPAR